MSIGVVGVIGLAVVSSTTAFLGLWHVNELMDLTLEEYLPSVRAAEELEIAVLEQRGFVSSYLLDRGNRHWLEELEKRRGSFQEGLNVARAVSSTREEHAILDRLETVFGQYAATREEVVALFDRGEVEAAEKLLIHRMTELFGQAYNLCEEFIAINIRYVDTAAADARRQARTVTTTVACCALLTVVLGSVVLWLFIYRIVFPVRALVADAQGFSADVVRETEPLPVD
jgi:CHASE3 domain sensor protein